MSPDAWHGSWEVNGQVLVPPWWCVWAGRAEFWRQEWAVRLACKVPCEVWLGRSPPTEPAQDSETQAAVMSEELWFLAWDGT